MSKYSSESCFDSYLANLLKSGRHNLQEVFFRWISIISYIFYTPSIAYYKYVVVRINFTILWKENCICIINYSITALLMRSIRKFKINLTAYKYIKGDIGKILILCVTVKCYGMNNIILTLSILQYCLLNMFNHLFIFQENHT